MSFITKRGLSTLIPPKVASPNAIGSSPNAVRMQKVVSFYEKLPRGPAPEIKPKGLLQRYQNRYMGKKASPAPLLHAIVVLAAIGYAQNYYFHLRHHKNNAH
ncbi:mitochondrial F1F0 ATP synthase subunit F Atp17 [Lophiotrema nucula]|uniref:Mitochondrial F1F0 ATP synthase subunit F Atp17 n=1 Tax=Lophiotrema nucula TaxID=690887 RepID=A0A6A5ZRC5_9PLEO|nr:mitochondrial F1F0 ATP synthase subunit F Atp17 [Lophiotrema nucula]